MCTLNSANRDRVIKFDGVDLMVTFMNKHPTNEAIQQEACLAINNLCINNGKCSSVDRIGGNKRLQFHIAWQSVALLLSHGHPLSIIKPNSYTLYSVTAFSPDSSVTMFHTPCDSATNRLITKCDTWMCDDRECDRMSVTSCHIHGQLAPFRCFRLTSSHDWNGRRKL